MINARATWWGKRVLAWFAAGVVVSLVIGVGAALVHRWVRSNSHKVYWAVFLREDAEREGFYTAGSDVYGVRWRLKSGLLVQALEQEGMGWIARSEGDYQTCTTPVSSVRQRWYVQDQRPPWWSMAATQGPQAKPAAHRSYEVWTDVVYGWPRPVAGSRLTNVATQFPKAVPGRAPRPIAPIVGEHASVRVDAPVLPMWLERALGDAAQDVPGRVLWSGLGVNALVWGGMLAGGWYGVVLTIAGLRGWRRRSAGRCLKCGYSRDGLAVGVVCPECGG